jgi:hypothetical protein
MRSAPRFSESPDDKTQREESCDHETDWPTITAPTHTTANWLQHNGLNRPTAQRAKDRWIEAKRPAAPACTVGA